jgi:glycosyltransferase involved in cell wall biosynthesis
MTSDSLSFCMVTTFYPPHHFGGDAVYVHRLSNELAARGHSVTVIHDPEAFALLGGQPGMPTTPQPGVAVEPIRTRWPRASPLVTYLTGRPGFKARQLRRALGRGRFDVVHFHNVSLVGGPELLAYGEGVKLYTMHEHWLVCPMHTLWKNNRELCERPTCVRCSLSYRRPPQLWRFGSILNRRVQDVDLFLAPSRFTMDMHRLREFNGPMRHLPPFVPRSEWMSASTEAVARPRPYFLVVGRLERLKGVQTLLDVFRRYDRADLVVVGDGSDGESLRRQASDLPHVSFTGTLPFDKLHSLYERAIAVIAPSVGYETFGLVTLEAFARRTPAIVRDRGGLSEAVTDSGGGFLYRTDAELVDAMEKVRNSPELRDELGRRGHDAYLTHWSEDAHLDAYLGLVAELRGGRAARPESTAREVA